MPAPDLWTINDVAQHIGASSTGSARRTLSRWGIRATQYQPHPESGRIQALYPADQIRATKASRPGRGRQGNTPD